MELTTTEEHTKYISQYMPEHFKPNFIYRHVWNNVWLKDLNATFCIIGIPGRGKSTLALRICEDLDPTFTTERVCYSIKRPRTPTSKKRKRQIKTRFSNTPRRNSKRSRSILKKSLIKKQTK